MKKLKLDFDIPDYLENDINAYIDAVNYYDLAVDCYYDEVFSSLRMAYGDHAIDDHQLQLLKKYYLGLNERE